MAQRQINLIDAILQAMFPVGTIQAFLPDITPPTGWQKINDLYTGDTIVEGENVGHINGQVLQHSHESTSDTYLFYQMNRHDGNDVYFSYLKGKVDHSTKKRYTSTSGGDRNIPSGFNGRYYVWDPKKEHLFKYDKLRFLRENKIDIYDSLRKQKLMYPLN